MEDELGLNDITGEDDIDNENSDDLSDIEPVPNTATSRVEEPEFEETPIEEPESNEEGAPEETPRRSGGRRVSNLRGRETASKEIPAGNKLAESTKLEEAINPSNKLYQYEVGVLLDEDNDEYEAYSEVWDKKHGYYNEDWGVELDLDSAKKLVKDYVSRGVLNTYGIISEIFLSDEELDDVKDNIEENGYFETSDYDMDYSLDNVIYSVYKSDNGIVENFVNMDLTENKLQERKDPEEDFEIDDEMANKVDYKVRVGDVVASYHRDTNTIVFYDEETGEDIDTIVYRNQTPEEIKEYMISKSGLNLTEGKLQEAPTEEDSEFKKLCAEIEFQADENDFTLTKEDIKGIAKKMVADKFFFNHDIFTDENDEEAWGEINDLIISAIEAYPNKLDETRELKENDDMEELNRLQDELRGVDVSKLSDEEYEEFKIKSDRVHELVNKLYDFHKLGESKTIIDNGDEIYTIDKNAKTYTIKTPKGEKTFTFDEMNEFVNRGKGMNRIYKPMSVLAYTDFKNGNLNKWNTRVED